MKHCLMGIAALAVAAASAPASAEATQDRAALMDWGYTIAGHVESDQSLIRMRDQLCLLVGSDDKALASKVARRVVDNAKEIGVRAKRGKCRPNAIIVFAENAQAQLADMNAGRGWVYGALYASQLDRIIASESDGFAFQQVYFEPTAAIGAFGTVTRTAPLRAQPFGSDMVGSLVVIDKAAAEGLDPVQLADYASLRLLAPTSNLHELPEAAEGRTDTILTLFRDRDKAPAGMTRFDRAYLEALYRLPSGSFARSIMARASKVAVADPQP